MFSSKSQSSLCGFMLGGEIKKLSKTRCKDLETCLFHLVINALWESVWKHKLCSNCSLEKEVTDAIKLKGFMEICSKCAVRAITDPSFLSPFSRFLPKWKQVFKALNCAFQQLPQKLLWLCVKAVKIQTCYFTKASIRIHYKFTRQLVEPFRSAFIWSPEGTHIQLLLLPLPSEQQDRIRVGGFLSL